MSLIGSPAGVSGSIVNIVNDSKSYDVSMKLCAKVPSTSGTGNMLIAMAYTSPNSFWFAGLDLTGALGAGSALVVGFFSGGVPFIEGSDPVGSPLTDFDTLSQVIVTVTQVGSIIRIDADAFPGSVFVETSTTFFPNNEVGVATFSSEIEVAKFSIGADFTCDTTCFE